MAHFAKLDENNTVIDINVVNNSVLLDGNNVEREELGIAFLVQWSGGHPYWKQTSYNSSFRGKYAGIGFKYIPEKNCFLAPKPYPSWQFDENICDWQPPVAKPSDNKEYIWDESTISWKQVF